MRNMPCRWRKKRITNTGGGSYVMTFLRTTGSVTFTAPRSGITHRVTSSLFNQATAMIAPVIVTTSLPSCLLHRVNDGDGTNAYRCYSHQ